VICFQLFSVLPKQSAILGRILLFLTTLPLFYGLLFSPRNVKISTFFNISLKSYFFVVLLPLIELKRDDDIGNRGTIKLTDLGF